MIVKNEEANLPACLESVKGLFDEIIIVDTGSTDRTKKIALQYGAIVSDFEWIDDFSAARNRSLDLATGQWIFWLDADHRVDQENYRKLRLLFDQLKEEKVAFQMHEYSWIRGLSNTQLHPRLFLRNPKIRWQYRDHEQIIFSLSEQKYRIQTVPIVIHHYGYITPSLSAGKVERNIRLLEMGMADNPDDINLQTHSLFHLSRSYRGIDKPDKALEAILRGIEITPKDKPYYYQNRQELIEVYINLKRWKDALDACKEAEKLNPYDADVVIWECQLWDKMGEISKAKECLLKIIDSKGAIHSDDLSTFDKVRYLLGVNQYKQGHEKDAEKQWLDLTVENPSFAIPWIALIDLWISQNRLEEALLICSKAKSHNTHVGDFLFRESIIHGKLHNPSKARSCLLELLQSWNSSCILETTLTITYVKHDLGVFYFAEGDFANAERQWRDVVNENPTHTISWLALTELWTKQNRQAEISKAIEYLQNTLKNKELANQIKTHQRDLMLNFLQGTTVLKRFSSTDWPEIP